RVLIDGQVDDFPNSPLLNSTSLWNAFEIPSRAGFIFIKNALKKGSSLHFANKCINEYAKASYWTNIDDTASVNNFSNLRFLKTKLRWIQMGYKFDYTSHTYETSIYKDLPDEIFDLFQNIGTKMGFPTFTPQTSIINFYPATGGEISRSKCAGLCGHQDIYEKNLTQPLISLSFGQPCVYLLGGDTKETIPTDQPFIFLTQT
ncbi:hypothetical protein MXB_980, partial [Myxobolus squamalis]